MRIAIDTDNAAFDEFPCSECARILRELADKIDEDGLPVPRELFVLRDVNGNQVGVCSSKG